MHYLKQNKIIKLGLMLILLLSFLFLFAQNNLRAVSPSPDAIATRVMPNPDHLSPWRWYQKNNFKGSPQKLLVDGYEAVRDGRTVYVNAANISGNDLYTNIYLLSFNQNVEQATQDIFSQLLSHWQFNTNIPPENKDNVRKDTKRLADLAEIKLALANYQKKHNNKYPSLSAGSYLANKTISTWPSWSQNLAKELGLTLPLDPINKLGPCLAGYDPATCWNQAEKKFYDPTPDDDEFNLPDDSHAYVYTAAADGSSYAVCSVMESGFLTPLHGDCLSQQNLNHLPIITCGALTGYPHDEFLGYVKALDPDGDSLQWSLDIGSLGADWSSWAGGAPTYCNFPGASLTFKQLCAEKAGDKGQYDLIIKVKDKAADWTRKDCSIVIKDGLPIISLIPPQTIHSGDSLNYLIQASEPTGQYPLSYTLTATDGGPDLSCTIQDQHDCLIDQIITASAGTYNYTVEVVDINNDAAETLMTLVVTEGLPIISPIPRQTVRSGDNLNYLIEASELDEQYPLSYTLTATDSVPGPTLSCTLQPNQHDCLINQIITASAGTYNYTVEVADSNSDAARTSMTLVVTEGLPIISPIPRQTVRSGDNLNYLIEASELGGQYPLSYTLIAADSVPGPTLSCTLQPNQHDCLINQIITASAGTYNYTVEVADSNSDEAETPMILDVTEIECKQLSASEIILEDGSGDGVVYDNDDSDDANLAENVVGGSYLKLGKVMPTPYIWVANTDIGKIAKIRIFDGQKRNCVRESGKIRCWWEDGTWENRGDLIDTYPVGQDPSRTAVNAETGDVWVGNRAGGSVTKLNINGDHLKTCPTGPRVRGVTIDKTGDVWVSNFNNKTIVKISGDDTNCNILKTVTVGRGGYGLTMDSKNNLWVVHKSRGASKINTTDYSITRFPAEGGYGITVDMNDNMWLGGSNGDDPDNALIKFAEDLVTPPQYFGPGYMGLGVSADLNGNIWAATYTDNGVIKADQNGNSLFGLMPDEVTFVQKPSGGREAIGMSGDSQGNMWVVNYASGNLRAFDSNGVELGTYPGHKPDEFSKTYSYSDMTGLNRAMIFRSGIWNSKIFDNDLVDQYWGKIEWQKNMPDGTAIEIAVRISADSISWTEYDASAWNNLAPSSRQARYLQIQATLRSSRKDKTPVLWDIKLKCN